MTPEQVEETKEKESLDFPRMISVSILMITTGGAIVERVLENEDAETWAIEVQRRLVEYYSLTGESFPAYKWKERVCEAKK